MALRIFKIQYDWYEEEHEEFLLGKEVEKEEFEKDLIEARIFAENLPEKEEENHEEFLGKCYNIKCLPEMYRQIVWYLTDKRGYTEYSFDEDIKYNISDSGDKEITLTKRETEIKNTEL